MYVLFPLHCFNIEIEVWRGDKNVKKEKKNPNIHDSFYINIMKYFLIVQKKKLVRRLKFVVTLGVITFELLLLLLVLKLVKAP